jgi:hypothetical protein
VRHETELDVNMLAELIGEQALRERRAAVTTKKADAIVPALVDEAPPKREPPNSSHVLVHVCCSRTCAV